MSAALLDVFTGRLRLEGVLTTRTGLHVGAGGSGDPLATDAPVVRNAAGSPFIPGSSLKGVIRSAAEALIRGAGGLKGSGKAIWACNPIAGDGEVCLSHAEVREIREEGLKAGHSEREIAEAVWEKSCTVCRLFGSLALASRARFPDLPLLGGVPLMELRNGVGIDRDKELAAPGVLYDFEAVPPETGFQLTVIVDNYSGDEVGLLLYLFDELDQGNLGLGGKVSRGLGQVRIEWQSIVETTIADKNNPFLRLLSSRDLLAPAAEPEEPETAVEPEPALPTTGDPLAWRTLAEIIREMPVIDKGELGQKAAERGFTKANLNEKLGLGLEGRKARKSWYFALERLAECGFLVATDAGYALAGEETAAVETETAAPVERDPALQRVIDDYVGAMARRWDEVFV